MNTASLFLLAIVTCGAALDMETIFWNQWKRENGKSYERREDIFRRHMWKKSMDHVSDHNARFKAGNVTFRIELNKFSDFGVTELASKYTRSYNYAWRFRKPTKVISAGKLPRQVDWRTGNRSCVTSIKEQGGPGSCYAFGAVGAIESQLCLKQGILTDLSVQQVLDCEINNCGGYIHEVYKYFKKHKGVMGADSYPYTNCLDCTQCLVKDPKRTFIPKVNRFLCDSQCKFNHRKVRAKVTGIRWVQPTEEALKRAVATVGPIAAGIDAKHNFPLYSGHNDVYHEPKCSSTRLNHAVLVVGYGTGKKGDYWIVKNSWGADWGADGYIRMSRNKNNNCGIATAALYPVIG